MQNKTMIDQRPVEVETKQQAGHWEGDLILGVGCRSAMMTLRERKTQYGIVVRTRTTTAYCVSTSPRAPTCPCTPRRTSPQSCKSSTPDHARAWTTTPRPHNFVPSPGALTPGTARPLPSDRQQVQLRVASTTRFRPPVPGSSPDGCAGTSQRTSGERQHGSPDDVPVRTLVQPKARGHPSSRSRSRTQNP